MLNRRAYGGGNIKQVILKQFSGLSYQRARGADPSLDGCLSHLKSNPQYISAKLITANVQSKLKFEFSGREEIHYSDSGDRGSSMWAIFYNPRNPTSTDPSALTTSDVIAYNSDYYAQQGTFVFSPHYTLETIKKLAIGNNVFFIGIDCQLTTSSSGKYLMFNEIRLTVQ